MEKKSLAEKLNKKYHKALEITDLKDLLYKSATRYTRRAAFKLKDKIFVMFGICCIFCLGIKPIVFNLKCEWHSSRKIIKLLRKSDCPHLTSFKHNVDFSHL